jgi:DNA-binding NarL/FixJ family response regulator
MQLSKITIAIADDHQICRNGIISYLDPDKFKIVGQADNGIDIIRIANECLPDIIFMDINMLKCDGIEAVRRIKKSSLNTKILAFSIYGQESYIIDMINAGASGYIMKTATKDEILEAIDLVLLGSIFYCKSSLKAMSKYLKFNHKYDKPRILFDLNEIEISIIKLICDEYTSAEISKLLFLSVRTIEGSRLRIQSKLNVSSTAGIVKFAIENGIYR